MDECVYFIYFFFENNLKEIGVGKWTFYWLNTGKIN